MGVACVLIEEDIRRKCNCLSENPEWERAREEREKSIQEKKQKEMQLLKTLNLKVRILIEKRESQKPRIIGYGNYCKNPCYEFNLSLFEKCPKCEGKITKEYENPFPSKQDMIILVIHTKLLIMIILLFVMLLSLINQFVKKMFLWKL